MKQQTETRSSHSADDVENQKRLSFSHNKSEGGDFEKKLRLTKEWHWNMKSSRNF